MTSTSPNSTRSRRTFRSPPGPPPPAEEPRAPRVERHPLEDLRARPEGAGLERDFRVPVQEVHEVRHLLEVEVFNRDLRELLLRRLPARPRCGVRRSVRHGHRPRETGRDQKGIHSFFGREQIAYSSPSKNTSRSGCCRWISWIFCMMSLRVIDSSFGSIRRWTFFCIGAPTAPGGRVFILAVESYPRYKDFWSFPPSPGGRRFPRRMAYIRSAAILTRNQRPPPP